MFGFKRYARRYSPKDSIVRVAPISNVLTSLAMFQLCVLTASIILTDLHCNCNVALHMLSHIIRFSTYHFYTLDSPVLYVILISSTLEHVSFTWNDFTLADSNLLEHIQLIASSCSTRLILPDLPPIIIQF
jgi:hypothetical protein